MYAQTPNTIHRIANSIMFRKGISNYFTFFLNLKAKDANSGAPGRRLSVS